MRAARSGRSHEFEKDIFKAILAKEGGKEVKALILVGKHGAVKRLAGAGPRAIMVWVARTQGIEVRIRDLGRPDLSATSVG
jgi:plasmid stability protein